MADEKKEAAKVKRPTAIKRDIQNLKRREENRTCKSQIKTAIKRFDEALKGDDANAKSASLDRVYALMDKGHKKGVVPANTASRTKSRLAARLVSKV